MSNKISNNFNSLLQMTKMLFKIDCCLCSIIIKTKHILNLLRLTDYICFLNVYDSLSHYLRIYLH